MSVCTKVFGTMKDGHKVTLYSIQNQKDRKFISIGCRTVRA